MKKMLLAVGLCVSLMGHAKAEGLTANLGVVSDYLIRGVSQSQNLPAVQAGAAFQHSSGLYTGVRTTNIRWGKSRDYMKNNGAEVDVYAGWRKKVGDLEFDTGVLRYIYTGSRTGAMPDPDTTEVYGGVSWGGIAFKYSRAVSSHFLGWRSPTGQASKGSQYFDLTVTREIPNGFIFGAHLGYQDIRNFSDASYVDWSLFVSKTFDFGTVKMMYSGTSADDCDSRSKTYCWDRKDVADHRVTFGLSKVF